MIATLANKSGSDVVTKNLFRSGQSEAFSPVLGGVVAPAADTPGLAIEFSRSVRGGAGPNDLVVLDGDKLSKRPDPSGTGDLGHRHRSLLYPFPGKIMRLMKTGIHPTWCPSAQVTCACGNSFTVGSTKPAIAVEICSRCHPFFTGEMKFVDTMGRVERFAHRQAAAVARGHVSKKMKKVLKKRQEEEEEARRPKSLKEMLDRVKSEARS